MAEIPKRKDARRNREAILEAARELFADSSDFPMAEVARRAGVGHGTLYRNFPDRTYLAASIMADEVDRLERLGAEHADDPDAFFVLLRRMTEAMARSSALMDSRPPGHGCRLCAGGDQAARPRHHEGPAPKGQGRRYGTARPYRRRRLLDPHDDPGCLVPG